MVMNNMYEDFHLLKKGFCQKINERIKKLLEVLL